MAAPKPAQPRVRNRLLPSAARPVFLLPRSEKHNLPSSGGAKTTIAIIDAFDNPNALADLTVFSKTFNLPAPNFEKHLMAPSIAADPVWGLEIAMDIQWAHAIAPDAKILLVEAESNKLPDLMAAIDYARARPDVVAISMSWGSREYFGNLCYDSHLTSQYGATFFASSGDSGSGLIWPACSPNVVAVGGTTLNLNPDGTVASETAWSGSGGGVAMMEAIPDYQLSYGISGAKNNRTVPDVSFNADPNTGYSVYDSFGQGGWMVVGGTSAGAPQWAAIQALGLSASNANFYRNARSAAYSSYFRDITKGSNGISATPGYDCVTGLGSPLTVKFNNSDFSMKADPSLQTISRTKTASYTITLTALNGYNSAVRLSVDGLPKGASARFSPSKITPTAGGATTELKINMGKAKPGTYNLVITTRAGSVFRSTPVTLIYK